MRTACHAPWHQPFLWLRDLCLPIHGICQIENAAEISSQGGLVAWGFAALLRRVANRYSQLSYGME